MPRSWLETLHWQSFAEIGYKLNNLHILIRTPLGHPRLDPPPTRWVDHQDRRVLVPLLTDQPPYRVDQADPIGIDTLNPRRLHHHRPHQVVRQGEHRQLLQDPVHRLTSQDVHLHT